MKPKHSLKDYLKNELRLIGCHFGVLMLNFVFISLTSWEIGKVLLYLAMTVCTACFYYTTAYKMASRDLQYHSKVSPYRIKGLVVGVIHISILGIISALLFWLKGPKENTNIILTMIYNVFTIPLAFWYRYLNKIPVFLYAFVALIPIFTATGYVLGVNKISIAQKYIVPLLYQKEE